MLSTRRRPRRSRHRHPRAGSRAASRPELGQAVQFAGSCPVVAMHGCRSVRPRNAPAARARTTRGRGVGRGSAPTQVTNSFASHLARRPSRCPRSSSTAPPAWPANRRCRSSNACGPREIGRMREAIAGHRFRCAIPDRQDRLQRRRSPERLELAPMSPPQRHRFSATAR